MGHTLWVKVRAAHGLPGADFLEHAPVPHGTRANVVVAFGRPEKAENSERYFKGIVRAYEYHSQPIGGYAMPSVRISQQIEELSTETVRLSRELHSKTPAADLPSTRIVTIAPVNLEGDPMRRAFRDFRKKVEEHFGLI